MEAMHHVLSLFSSGRGGLATETTAFNSGRSNEDSGASHKHLSAPACLIPATIAPAAAADKGACGASGLGAEPAGSKGRCGGGGEQQASSSTGEAVGLLVQVCTYVELSFFSTDFPFFFPLLFS